MKLKRAEFSKTTIEVFEAWEGSPIDIVKKTVSSDNSVTTSWSIEGKGPLESFPLAVKSNWQEILKNPSGNPFVPTKFLDPIFITNNNELNNLILWNSDLKNRVVWVYSSGHMLFDMDGKAIPIPEKFSYIGSIFNNEYLNLDDVVLHLKKHPWIINSDELKIEDIPHYNRSAKKNKYISPVILPDKEEYNKLFELAKKEKEKEKENNIFPVSAGSSTVLLKQMISSSIFYGYDPLGIWQFLTKKGNRVATKYDKRKNSNKPGL